jgi:hypothetical protein
MSDSRVSTDTNGAPRKMIRLRADLTILAELATALTRARALQIAA